MARGRLSRDAVTAAALELVDDGGYLAFSGLTLAAVAARTGVAVPSLYKHVGSLADLRRSVALAAVSELTGRCSKAAVGRSGPEALFALAAAVRAFARQHPGRYAAAQVAADLQDPADGPLAAAGAETVAVISGVLRGFGLPPERTVDAVRAVRAAVHGFVQLEVSGGFGMPDDVDKSFEVMVAMLEAGLRELAL
ncbi:MAG TPA: WHG domain-containing protein [Micrococcaceae bacterium]|nr:WHG domain-containing protein [Micrococcaceae bacterium]